jgi:hypothetical protein
MPTVRIPLVGVANQRGNDAQATIVAGEDQRFVNCVFSVTNNPVTGKASAYVEKRPGWGQASLVASGQVSTGLIRTDSIGAVLSAFGDTNSTLYESTTSVGTITGRALFFSETIVSDVGYVLIRSSDGTGWYYAEDAKDQTSYTGDTTNGSPTVSNIASTAGMYSGQAISGSGIPASTRILTVDSATAITLNANATATASGVTLTKTPIAKILDADFVTTGSAISALVDMDGFLFYSTDDGYIRNGELNSITSYSSTAKVAVQMSPDAPVAVARYKHSILCFGTDSIETFRNAGNATGSPLARVPDAHSKVGAQGQRSIATLADDIYFASSSRDGDVQIKKLPGMETISTPAVDRMLGTIAVNATIYLSAFQLGGYPYVSAFVITATEDDEMLLLENDDKMLLESGDDFLLEGSASEASSFGRHLIYNASLRVWSEWDSTIPTFVIGQGLGATNQILATSRINNSGKVYTINPVSDGDLYQDDGSTYTMTITTSRVDHGTNKRKFIRAVRLIGDVQDSGSAALSYSDDDYATFTSAGDFDLTITNPKLQGLGSYEGGRVWKLEHSANTAFRAEALEIEYEVGR